jgi:transcriptional regulator with XRE-family HTH domain
VTKLEAARLARGWSQTKLGWRARLAQSQISGFEQRRITVGPEQAKRLSRALGVPADELTQDAETKQASV